MKIKGKYVTGIGKGAFFVGLEGYWSQIQKLVKFRPFPGTLNVEVSEAVVKEIEKLEFIGIPGFEQDGKKFGGCKMRPAVVEGLPCFLIIPERTTHPKNVLEFISLFELKKELKLKPEDEIEIRI
jgi:riboflavin kinase